MQIVFLLSFLGYDYRSVCVEAKFTNRLQIIIVWPNDRDADEHMITLVRNKEAQYDIKWIVRRNIAQFNTKMPQPPCC